MRLSSTLFPRVPRSLSLWNIKSCLSTIAAASSSIPPSSIRSSTNSSTPTSRSPPVLPKTRSNQTHTPNLTTARAFDKCESISSTLGLYASLRMPRSGADAGVAIAALVRISYLVGNAPPADAARLHNDAAAALYIDLLRALRGTPDRIFATLVYSLGKVDDSARVCTGSSSAAAAARTLKEALVVVACDTLKVHTLPPRVVAMTALGLARLAPTEAAARGAWIHITETLEKAARQVHSSGDPSTSTLAPGDVTMIAAAFNAAGGATPRAVTAIAALATPSALGAYPHRGIVALAACACGTHRSERPPLRTTATTTTTTTTTSSTSTATAVSTDRDARLGLLFAIAEEVSLRLATQRITQGESAEAEADSSPDSWNSASVDLRGLEDVGDPVLRAALARSRAARSHSIIRTLERVAPFPPRAAASFLYWFSIAGLRPPQLFGGITRFLAGVSESSGSDSGGALGFRDRFSHVNSGGDVARLSTLEAGGLASTAWAVARARYEGPHSPAFWAATLASARARLAIGTWGRSLRAGDVGTLAWAVTMASVPAQAFCADALAAAAARPSHFSLLALAQICWAAAIQGVVTHAALTPILAHVIESAEIAEALEKREGRKVSKSPDAFVAMLLHPVISTNDVEGILASTTKRVQGQLYTALLALSVGGGELGAAHAIVPEITIRAWKSALAGATRSSRLHADVSRVLTAAGLAHSNEVTTPAGLVVDILLGNDELVNVVESKNALPSQGIIIIEVQGPSHFTRGLDTAAALTSLSRVGDGAGGTPVLAIDALLARGPGDDSIPLSLGGDADAAAAAATVLVPTLRTRAKRGWLASAGFQIVEINFAEWASRASTQEKMELLSEKGVPIDEKYL